jgi:molecular chaperone GrpE
MPRSSTSRRSRQRMSDTNPTVEERTTSGPEQPAEHPGNDKHSPDAPAPGEGAPSGQGEAAASGQEPEAQAGAKKTASHHPAEDGAAEIAGDLDELVRTAAERDQYLALAQRTQADFENYRKRVAREAAAAQERGVSALARELLPALDNLDRALDAAAKDDPLLDGVRLVRSELSAGLARVGIESFCPIGESFDPELHEAVATAEQAEDGQPSGTVVEVYQPGYRLRDSIIRPARVVVAA